MIDLIKPSQIPIVTINPLKNKLGLKNINIIEPPKFSTNNQFSRKSESRERAKTDYNEN